MALDMKRNKTLDYKSDIKEFSNQKDEQDVLIDEGYQRWLNIGGLQDSPNNYKKYLEDLKEASEKEKNKPSAEEVENARKSIEDNMRKGEELLAMLDMAIQRESNTEVQEESHTFRH